jgi:hypothetical protein
MDDLAPLAIGDRIINLNQVAYAERVDDSVRISLAESCASVLVLLGSEAEAFRTEYRKHAVPHEQLGGSPGVNSAHPPR